MTEWSEMKVIICGGGTVGHLTPGISIAEIIQKNERNSAVLFIGRENGDENDVIIRNGFKLKTLKISSFKRRITTKNLKAFSIMLKALRESKKIIKKESPDIVIGTGGYVCWPVIRAAQKMKIPTVMHESNFSPGLATRSLASRCDKIMLHFALSEKEFKRKDNLVTVGNPIPEAFSRITREEARKKLGLTDRDFFILSFGGSGGAEKMNESIISLMKNYSSRKIEIKHLHACGKKYFEQMKKENDALAKGHNGCKIVPFIEEMPTYMKAADTVISRSGAMTLSELSECEIAPILIPSPNVTNNHQYKNAKTFTDSGAALMIEEHELNDRTLIDAVRYLQTNKGIREKIKKEIAKFKSVNAKKLIYEVIKTTAKK